MPPVNQKTAAKPAAKSKTEDKQATAWFRVKAGIAVVPDLAADYDPTPHPQTGAVPKRPSKQVGVGDSFEATSDYVAKHGAEKFERIATPRRGRDGKVEKGSPLAYDADGNPLTGDFGPGDVSPQAMSEGVAVAPHGQVSTGFQQTGGGYPKERPSGALNVPEDQLGEDAEETLADKRAQQGADDGEGDEGDVQGDKEPDYGQMTVAELDQYAADNEIDLSRAHNKADKVKAIRKAAKKGK